MILLNLYAWSIVILQDLYKEYESIWETQEIILMWYFIIELLIGIAVHKSPRYKILFKISFYIDILVITPIFLLVIFKLGKKDF